MFKDMYFYFKCAFLIQICTLNGFIPKRIAIYLQNEMLLPERDTKLLNISLNSTALNDGCYLYLCSAPIACHYNLWHLTEKSIRNNIKRFGDLKTIFMKTE